MHINIQTTRWDQTFSMHRRHFSSYDVCISNDNLISWLIMSLSNIAVYVRDMELKCLYYMAPQCVLDTTHTWINYGIFTGYMTMALCENIQSHLFALEKQLFIFMWLYQRLWKLKNNVKHLTMAKVGLIWDNFSNFKTLKPYSSILNRTTLNMTKR